MGWLVGIVVLVVGGAASSTADERVCLRRGVVERAVSVNRRCGVSEHKGLISHKEVIYLQIEKMQI